MPRRGLGRGLEAILGAAAESAEELRDLDLEDIIPNPRQPRAAFSEDKLAELAASIREHGIVQPVLVRPFGDRFELIAGERRWRAARLAGLRTMPAVVRRLNDRESLELALVENLQREDLTPIEEARAYRLMMETMEMTQEQVAARLGVSRPAVANALRLLTLPEDIQDLLERGVITAGHARALVGLDARAQAEMVARITTGGFTVRDIEDLVRQQAARPKRERAKAEAPAADPDALDLEARLCTALGTRVRLLRRGGRGTLLIEFHSEDELERLLEALLALGDR